MIKITFKHMSNKILWINRAVSINYNRKYSSKSTKKLLEFLAEMPKVSTGRIAEAQRQRQQIAKKSEKYGPSTVYLQVLGSGARGVPNTLYLFTDQKRYLFNCGECTQRLAHEHKVKLSRLEHIFITSKTWRNIGGLPGLSLTLQDVGVPNITLHGPEGLDELYNATRRFVIIKEMNVNMAKCTPAEDFEDNTMTVKYVLLGQHDILQTDPAPAAKKVKREVPHRDAEFEEFIHDDTDYYTRDVKSQDAKITTTKKENTKQNIKPADIDSVKEKFLNVLQKTAQCTVAYICTIKKRLGTLDLEKCVERGVKPGPLLGQLKSGHDVVLPDGNVVRSADVKTPDDPGPVFIVLEVPDISYLLEEEFSAHFDNGLNPKENIPSLVVHFTPPHVFHDHKYRGFMEKFGNTTKHLVVNSQNSCLGSEAVHRTQQKLHLLDADIFPLLRDISIPVVWSSNPEPNKNNLTKQKELEELKKKIASAQFQKIINMEGSGKGDAGVRGAASSDAQAPDVMAGRTLSVYHLRPKNGLDRSAEPKLHVQDYIQEAMSMDGFVSSLDRFRQLVDRVRYANKNTQKEFPKVIFLGTGSCIPSKTRNTSAVVLQIDENRSMLLDCGEGTFGQLVRFFGPKRVNPFLKTLRAVYVSHLHADHHIGLIGVLQARREAFQETRDAQDTPVPPLYLLAPGQIMSWLSMYDQQFEGIRQDFTLIPNQNLLTSKVKDTGEHALSPALLAWIGIDSAVTCLVAHCPNAFGLALQLQTHKITYSGDTIPCDELVNIGLDSTLLIHEATMEDELAHEARLKMHSTTSQAIEVGRRMRACFTLLTHFSQRYARLPRLHAHMLTDSCSVGIAFDNMQVSMNDLELLPHMYAPLQLMFAEHCFELEMKAAHRARQKERRTSSPNIPSDKSKMRQDPSCDSKKKVLRYDSYRDSNSSRLRFELRRNLGYTLKTVRSKSCSPTKVSTQIRVPKSNNTSVGGSLEKLAVIDKKPISKTGTNQDITAKIITPSFNYVNIIDSRSKTINTAFRPCSMNREVTSSGYGRNVTGKIQTVTNTCVTKPINKTGTNQDITAKTTTPSFNCVNTIDRESRVKETGQGRPIVVPLDRKLPVRRQSRITMKPLSKTVTNQDITAKTTTPSANCVNTIDKSENLPNHIPRSPMNSWKAEISVPPIRSNRRNLNTSRLSFKSSRRRDDERESVSVAGTSKTMCDPLTKRPRPPVTRVIQRRSLSSLRSSLEKESQGLSPTRTRSVSRSRPKNNIKPNEDIGSQHNMNSLISNERKKTICTNEKAPGYYNGRSNHSSTKSFKPQLADIKSSFLILNSMKMDKIITNPVEQEFIK